MKKRIIVYADGTWNTPANTDRNKVTPTNVFRMFEKTKEGIVDDKPVDGQAGGKILQLAYYAEGVGTGRGRDKISGGLFGKGIDENIIEGYRFIVDNYEPGDEIFLLGFSRGAYTVRSISGLIKNCGILKKQYHQKIDRAFEIYRSRSAKHDPTSEECKVFRRFFSHPMLSTSITFIGVWDTVGSLGVPFKIFNWRRRRFRFHDVQLNNVVRNAYHAISIDERRVFFRPTLWRKQAKEYLKDQTLEQVWFNGVHSDVGGGYSEGDLYVLPLHYIINRAGQHGLQLEAEPISIEDLKKHSKSKINDSKDAFHYRIFPDYFRPVATSHVKGLHLFQRIGMIYLKLIIKGDKEHEHLATNEFLHESVVCRYEDDPDAMPVNLKDMYKNLVSENRIVGF